MRLRAALLAALLAALVAGCAPTSQPGDGLPPGYPPKIGEVAAEVNGVAQRWDTYDYSIGAFDAAVQIMDFNGEVQLRLMGEPAGKPRSKSNRLVMKAVMTDKLQTGPLSGVVIEIIAGEDWNGLRLSSEGSAAEVVIDQVSVKPESAVTGHVAGSFRAILCTTTGQPAIVDRDKCQPVRGTFASDLQFSGL